MCTACHGKKRSQCVSVLRFHVSGHIKEWSGLKMKNCRPKCRSRVWNIKFAPLVAIIWSHCFLNDFESHASLWRKFGPFFFTAVLRFIEVCGYLACNITIELRSEIWLNHCNNHSVVDLMLCLGSLSWCITKFRPSVSCQTDGLTLDSTILWYAEKFMVDTVAATNVLDSCYEVFVLICCVQFSPNMAPCTVTTHVCFGLVV